MKFGEDKNYKINQIRFNFINKHYGQIKAIVFVDNQKLITSVFISTKDNDEGRKNVPLDNPLILNEKEGKYFIKRVRTYNAKSYTNKFIEDALSQKDIKKSDEIYAIYLENKKRQPR